MRKKRFRLRLVAATLFALLLAPFAAPTSALAYDVSCGQNQCPCCICLCNCGCGGNNSALNQNGCNASGQINESTTEESADNNENVSPSEEPTVAEPIPNTSALIRFSELLPNPVGTDTQGEFIELTNLGVTDIEMTGWSIRNTGGKEFALPPGKLAAGSTLTLPYSETKITLTNAGLTLELVDPNGELKDSVTYLDEVEEGQAYAKSGNQWFWTTTPTPGFDNVITIEEQSVTDNDQSVSGTAGNQSDDNNADVNNENQPELPSIKVVINELLPAPQGDDATEEWIELYNENATEAVLSGWKLDDVEGGSNPYVMPNETIVPIHGFLVLKRPTTKLTLNNDADSVRLLMPDGTIVDEVSYDGAKEGEALARFGTNWVWTSTPTPGATNTLPADLENELNIENDSIENSTNESAAADEVPALLTVEQVHAVPYETAVTVTGIVTMPLGVVGTTIFGLRDPDANYGATVRIYATDRPVLRVGDIVVVTGTARKKDSGELRIDTSGPNPVVVVGHVQSVVAPEFRLEELDGTGAGLAVTVSGTVADVGGSWFVLTDNNAERELKIELPIGSAVPVKSGDLVTVNGIVRVERSLVALAVLDEQDIIDNPVEDETIDDAINDVAGLEVATDTESSGGASGAIPFLVVGALGAGGVAYRGLKTRQNEKKRLLV